MKRFITSCFSSCISFDSRLCIRIYRLSGKSFIDHVFYTVSRIGDGWLYALIAVVFFIFRRAEAVALLPSAVAAFAIESIAYAVIKKNVKRIRPFKTIEDITSLIIPPDEFSFPSGHTAAATVFALLCASVYPELSPALTAYVILIGFSRIYNGVHYPGDVFAGAALGMICGKLALYLF